MSIRKFDYYNGKEIPEFFGYTNEGMTGIITKDYTLLAEGSTDASYFKEIEDFKTIEGFMLEIKIRERSGVPSCPFGSFSCNVKVYDAYNNGFELMFRDSSGYNSIILKAKYEVYIISFYKNFLKTFHFIKIIVNEGEIRVWLDGQDTGIEIPYTFGNLISRVEMSTYKGGLQTWEIDYFNFSYLVSSGTGYGEGGYGKGYYGGESYFDITDSIAKQSMILQEKIGAKDFPGTVAYTAWKNIERIEAEGLEDLLQASVQSYTKLVSPEYFFDLFRNLIEQIMIAYGSLDEYFFYYNRKSSPEFANLARIRYGISPKLVYSPTLILGEFIFDDLSGKFVDGNFIDPNLYDAQFLVLQLLTDFNVPAMVKIKSRIEGNKIMDEYITIPVQQSGFEIMMRDYKYFDIVNITKISGGETGSKIRIFAKREREIGL